MVVKNVNFNGFGEFVNQWMGLPHETRKTLSHDGFIHCRADEDPCHRHFSELNIKSFDPGNYFYGIAMDFLCPQYQSWYTIATKGDIFESILGLNYKHRRDLYYDCLNNRDIPADRLRLCAKAGRLAHIINVVVYMVYLFGSRGPSLAIAFSEFLAENKLTWSREIAERFLRLANECERVWLRWYQ